MRLTLISCLLALSTIAPITAHAQRVTDRELPPIVVDPAQATQHLLSHPAPNYPPIARAAHVSGQVKLQIEIDESGQVGSTNSISGPPMLIGAAEDCVKKWVYAPFINAGQPTPATTIVTVNFDLAAPSNPNDEKIAAAFFPLAEACHKAMASNADPTQQADACLQAAAIANTFSPQARFIERRSAYVYASTALRRNKQPQEALDYANKAVAVVEQGHDDASGSSAAYGARAQAEAYIGDFAAADLDLTQAEGFIRDAIRTLNSTTLKTEYTRSLKGTLSLHAQVLNSLGNPDAAQAKTDEAAKL